MIFVDLAVCGSSLDNCLTSKYSQRSQSPSKHEQSFQRSNSKLRYFRKCLFLKTLAFHEFHTHVQKASGKTWLSPGFKFSRFSHDLSVGPFSAMTTICTIQPRAESISHTLSWNGNGNGKPSETVWVFWRWRMACSDDIYRYLPFFTLWKGVTIKTKFARQRGREKSIEQSLQKQTAGSLAQ